MSLGEHSYAVTATWTGNRGPGTTGIRDYDRSVQVEVAGKPSLLGSADVPFRGDPKRWNPEDLLLASLAQCHLLSYLHACVVADVVVLDYTDHATATMVQQGNGGHFTEVVLHPEVLVAEPSMVEAAEAAHATANSWCFIANSVNFPVRHQATVRSR